MSDEWIAFVDPESNMPFYYCVADGTTTWNNPNQAVSQLGLSTVELNSSLSYQMEIHPPEDEAVPPYAASTMMSMAFSTPVLANETSAVPSNSSSANHAEISNVITNSNLVDTTLTNEPRAPKKKQRVSAASFEINEFSSDVLPLRRLSDFATKMKLNKNYAEITRDHMDRTPYIKKPDGLYRSDIMCVLCKIQKPVDILFPCEHLVVCRMVRLTHSHNPV